MLGHASQRRQERQRFEASIGVVGDAALDRIPDGHVVGDEDGVDPGPLGRLHEFAVEVEVQHFPARRPRMAPRHPMIALRVEEKCAEDHVISSHTVLLPNLLRRPSRCLDRRRQSVLSRER